MPYTVLLFVGVLLNVLAQFLLKTGMTRVGPIALDHTFAAKALAMLGSAYFWMGLVTYGVSFVVYSIVLSKVELGRAYPISSVTAILLLTVIGFVFLRETLTLGKVLGIVLCSAGILLIFR